MFLKNVNHIPEDSSLPSIITSISKIVTRFTFLLQDADSNSRATNLAKMRAQRLKREQEERKRTDALLAKLRGEPDPKTAKSDPVPTLTQRYHSQFNPHLARQNKL